MFERLKQLFGFGPKESTPRRPVNSYAPLPPAKLLAPSQVDDAAIRRIRELKSAAPLKKPVAQQFPARNPDRPYNSPPSRDTYVDTGIMSPLHPLNPIYGDYSSPSESSSSSSCSPSHSSSYDSSSSSSDSGSCDSGGSSD